MAVCVANQALHQPPARFAPVGQLFLEPLDVQPEQGSLAVSTVGQGDRPQRYHQDEDKDGNPDGIDSQDAADTSIGRRADRQPFIPPVTLCTLVKPPRSRTLAATMDR